MRRHRKLIIGGIIIAVAVAALGYASFMGAGTYYYEVGELLDKGTALTGQTTRVSGEVGSDVISEGPALSFTLLDMTGRAISLPVLFRGQVPNAFETGRQVVVEGKLGLDGIFQASSIIAKCSSKYEPELPS
jgi:cytochrome c-type biogenesis protein CcmE